MEIIQWIQGLLVDYGAINVIIMLLTIFITNLIKKPIVNHAEDFVASAKKLLNADVDKSVITSNIVYIPVGVAFILYTVYTIIIVNFNISAIVWTELVSNSVVYGMLSMSIYEIGKAKLKSYIGKKTYTQAKTQLKELAKDEREKDLLVKNSEVGEPDTQEANQNFIKEN
jgi:hypothetical protein